MADIGHESLSYKRVKHKQKHLIPQPHGIKLTEDTKQINVRDQKFNASILTMQRLDTCTPEHNFIYVKTYKTGSSTLAALLKRYGLRNNLTAALSSLSTKLNLLRIRESEVLAIKYSCIETFPGYNYIASHIQNYDYNSLKALIPTAKFVSILRSPFKQFESLYYYTRNTKRLENSSNPFATYLQKTEASKRKVKSFLDCFGIKAGQESRLVELDKEFDLVLITEYMDESLVLLKKMMCWTFDDILYRSRKVSKRKRQPITKAMERILSKGLANDLIVYQHFNRTLWHKIDNYDGDFEHDLFRFRARLSEVTENCDKAENIHDRYCILLKSDVNYLDQLIKSTQLNRFCGY
ncbi:galactosylceramide sulfotransferase-like [Saccoglossus kowalevskii]